MHEPPGHIAAGLTSAQRLAWLRLIRSENVGPITFRQLVNRFGGAVAALEALPELSRRGGLRRTISICSEANAQREMEQGRKAGMALIALGEEGYPKYLAAVESAPPLLYVLGNHALLSRPSVAIVGSRNCSALGRKVAGQIAERLGSAGCTVVSGMARGIDAAAHAASLGSGTCAVLAGGADNVYPPDNQTLYERIVGQGCVISEMAPGYQPTGRDFPKRNRIVAATSLATVIVEAANRSGSLITARMAAEMGRDVFAVPGSPLDPRAEGTNGLIREGAILTRHADDVLEVIAPLMERPPPHVEVPLGEDDQPSALSDEPPRDAREHLAMALSPSPVEIDDLLRHTGLSPGVLHMLLLELELAGRLARHPGGRVSLNI
jgi:DNA processing protein